MAKHDVLLEQEMEEVEEGEKFIRGHLRRNKSLLTKENLSLLNRYWGSGGRKVVKESLDALRIPGKERVSRDQVRGILTEAYGIMNRYFAIQEEEITVGSRVTITKHRDLEFEVIGITSDYHLRLRGIIDPTYGIINQPPPSSEI